MKRPDTNKSIHDQIQEAFGIDLPIGEGTGEIDDPIVMKVDENYVHNEYMVLEFLGYYRSFSWQRVRQQLFCIGEKQIDCIEISVTDLMDCTCTVAEWTEEIYFDVTDCLEKDLQMLNQID